jgi:glycerate 2-kinase
MSLRILVVPDKFKGTLTAAQAALAMVDGWRASRPHDTLESIPMSDGGDGFGDVLSRLFQAAPQTTRTVDAAHRPRDGRWWWEPREQTAIIESAQVVGLAHLPEKQFHPFDLDTAGLGPLIEAATNLGARRCLIGIGGSATNDGGFGLARSLGWTFLDSKDQAIEQWTRLNTLQRLVPPEISRWPADVTVAVDVQNPLLGPTGASRIYGPQKGLTESDMPHAEQCLGQLARTLASASGPGRDPSVPGDGAAGGLGYGLRNFLGAHLESGFELFRKHSRLEDRIREADLILTGEGSIDASTRMGKGVGEIALLAREHSKPCIGFAGVLGPGSDDLFHRLYAMAPDLADAQEATRNAALWLSRLVRQTAANWRTDLDFQ